MPKPVNRNLWASLYARPGREFPGCPLELISSMIRFTAARLKNSAMENASSSELAMIKQSLTAEELPQETLSAVIDIVRSGDSLDYTRQQAEEQANAARACLSNLPDSSYLDAMQQLVDFSVQRSS